MQFHTSRRRRNQKYRERKRETNTEAAMQQLHITHYITFTVSFKENRTANKIHNKENIFITWEREKRVCCFVYVLCVSVYIMHMNTSRLLFNLVCTYNIVSYGENGEKEKQNRTEKQKRHLSMYICTYDSCLHLIVWIIQIHNDDTKCDECVYLFTRIHKVLQFFEFFRLVREIHIYKHRTYSRVYEYT